jgi:hypothetical protein
MLTQKRGEVGTAATIKPGKWRSLTVNTGMVTARRRLAIHGLRTISKKHNYMFLLYFLCR